MNVTYWEELTRQLFFLTAAGLGALFATLYPITAAATAGTYDENDDASYIMRIVVGLISGTILGQLITVDDAGGLGGLTRPTLALIGGFSASLVFKILSRMVQGIESIFSDGVGDGGYTSGGWAAAANTKAEVKVLAEREAIARELMELKGQELQGSPTYLRLDDLIGRIIRGELAA